MLENVESYKIEVFQKMEHNLNTALSNCGSAVRLLEFFINKPGVINEEHSEEINNRMKTVMDTFNNLGKLADINILFK
jgi:hypothetical protein